VFLQLADGKLVELHVAAEKMREIPIKPIKTHYIPCYPMLSHAIPSFWLVRILFDIPFRPVISPIPFVEADWNRSGRCFLAWRRWYFAYGRHPGTAQQRALCFNPSVQAADFEERFIGKASSCLRCWMVGWDGWDADINIIW